MLNNFLLFEIANSQFSFPKFSNFHRKPTLNLQICNYFLLTTAPLPYSESEILPNNYFVCILK